MKEMLFRVAPVAAVMVFVSTSLQGCDIPHVEGYFALSFDIKTHKKANWRNKPDYWHKFSYEAPGTKKEMFNSCSNPQVSAVDVCSGRGHCEQFNPDDRVNPVFFCVCQDKYGDPECSTVRKRQSTAWAIALWLGWTGAEQVYLEFMYHAYAKLMVLAFGILLACVGWGYLGTAVILPWWFIDVIRIGTAPVAAAQFRTNPDLPRWGFAVGTIIFYALVGFGFGVTSIFHHITKRRRLADEGSYYGSAKVLN
eukprot:gnl/TRDRNA2_/TRDRNA2_183166_c0_seq1.p1 gnl/TRDRNA2_/TRDRNA2_183166_c0~~gnl/TRDRNA2_/TRDRNA2_183166_c0_seq1.p1  ORF type:complete len:292 (-),score=49.54 gnl/TRDRNA2_/TRDRNA2_183166_c0_seq1:113-868(-)